MMPRMHFRNLFYYLTVGCLLLFPLASSAAESAEAFSLKETINRALEANLGLKQSQEEVRAAQEIKKSRITEFLPTLSASYDYLHRNKELTQELTGVAAAEFVVRPQDEYTFVTSFTQPVFRGFSLINQYKIADLGL
ncbi:MAG: TolC family protein, partial [Desulfobacterales bacterium]